MSFRALKLLPLFTVVTPCSASLLHLWYCLHATISEDLERFLGSWQAKPTMPSETLVRHGQLASRAKNVREGFGDLRSLKYPFTFDQMLFQSGYIDGVSAQKREARFHFEGK